MKTIKIIDLLNKIANGEEVPKKIRFDNTNWNRICDEKNVYYVNDTDDDLFIYFFRKNLTFTLNDKVEIIEEEKEIEKCDVLKHCVDFTKNENILLDNQLGLQKKINELIDVVNELKGKSE